MTGLDAPLRRVAGGRTAATLSGQLHLETVGDLLTDLADLVPGEHVTVQAQVSKTKSVRVREKLHKTDVEVTDGRRTLLLTFFNQIWRAGELRPGVTALFAGRVEDFKGRRQLTNPDVQRLDGGPDGAAEFAGALIPIYPATAKCPSWTVARAVRLVLDTLDLAPDDDPLPAALRQREGLPGLAEAFRLVHRPDTRRDAARGRARLAWDEALLVQVALAQRRAAAERLPATPRPPRGDGLLAAFDAALPFRLTDGQRAIGDELAGEVSGAHPMHRLLQGEVGSGKTVVALRAMLQVVDAGGQAALLAPTEVLAGQHARALAALLGPLGQAGELTAAPVATRIALLTGSQGAAARRAALDEAASGTAGIVVGTHALLELSVQWKDLGLLVVDEQHRFGVEQRDALRAQGAAYGATPHVLVMTATPIPRTVAMTVYGDLEVSALTELPRGRQPVVTHVVPAEQAGWLGRMWARVQREVAAGRQAFVVCPRISPDTDGEEGDAPPGGAAVEEVLPLLRDGALRGLRLAPLHGRLPGEEKDATMARFARGEVDVLVATTVVEVGVDVPNATVMVVLDADRYGVSQLHQLRGRVGRGAAASTCLLHTGAPAGSPARERLDAVAGTLDGAELARLDLSQRREGDVLGASQSGRRGKLRILNLLRDEQLIRSARAVAADLVAGDPGLVAQPGLARALAAALREEDAAYLEKG